MESRISNTPQRFVLGISLAALAFAGCGESTGGSEDNVIWCAIEELPGDATWDEVYGAVLACNENLQVVFDYESLNDLTDQAYTELHPQD